MLVVLGIITAITGIVLNGQSSFNKTIVLSNAAYDVALSIRAAETRGMGGKTINSVPTGYGIHFAKVAPPGTINSYLLFADTSPEITVTSPGACHTITDVSNLDAQPGDCAYNSGSNTDTLALTATYTLGNGMTIGDFCILDGSWSCANSSTNFNALDIVFARPNPDALMAKNGTYSPTATRACVKLVSPQGGARYISVESSGAINANSTTCP